VKRESHNIILTSLRDAKPLEKCGCKDLHFEEVILVDSSAEAVADQILNMELDARAVAPMDIMLVEAFRAIRRQEVQRMGVLARVNALLTDYCGIGYVSGKNEFRAEILAALGSAWWGIEPRPQERKIIENFLAELVECYSGIKEHCLEAVFPLICTAYLLITLGHLPFEIKDGKLVAW